MRISAWYGEESEKITLMSRSKDINLNKKVRVYHHSLHMQFRKRTSITKLESPQGIVTSHNACAAALEANVAAHLLHPAPLDPAAQLLLLEEVQVSFSDQDNEKLMAPPTSQEVKKVLNLCGAHSAPGTDSLTAYFYQKNWETMADPLTDVIRHAFQGNKPSPDQRTSIMVFGNKPGKKTKSLKISDRRKLSLLNVDFKIITGIEAAWIKATMCRTISPLQLVWGGSKRISHGIAMARDAINAAGKAKSECGILDTDLVAAFCNMVLTWCLKVMLKKGLDSRVVARYLNIYEDNQSVIVVNNIKGRSICNTRMSVRQGDKFSMGLFSFGMNPILAYLQKRLTGILIHSIPRQGPLQAPAPPPPHAPARFQVPPALLPGPLQA